jgi:hypothetical protein
VKQLKNKMQDHQNKKVIDILKQLIDGVEHNEVDISFFLISMLI